MHTTADPAIISPKEFPPNRSIFFSRLALLITIMVFAGFILNWVVNYGQPRRFTLWIGLHGAFSAAWYLLLLNQLRLARSGDIARHMRWGKFSLALVIAILLTGVVMTLGLYDFLAGVGVFDATDAEARVRAGGLIGGTFLEWTIFAIVYGLGVLNVRRPTHHKRFMLASAIQMMPASLSRLVDVLGLPGPVMLAIMLSLYLTIMAYDWKSDRRVHWSTLVSLSLFILMASSVYTVFRSQAWGDWVVGMLGVS